MKRDMIIIEDNTVSVTGNEIRMTATEIAGLFHTGVPAVNAAIGAVRKPDVLNDHEVCRYMRFENGLSADVYSLEVIIPATFRLSTYHARLFHRWLMGKVLTKDKHIAYMVFVHSGKSGYCRKDDDNQLKTDNHQAVRFNFKIANSEYTNCLLKSMRYQN